MWGVEDGPDRRRHLPFQLLPGHVGLRILLEMKLATLPRHAPEDRQPRCLQATMRITDQQLHATQPALDQVLQEGSPVHLLF